MEDKKTALWIGLALSAAAIGGGLYWNFGRRSEILPPVALTPSAPQEQAQASSIVLPKLAESDDFFREQLKKLTANPQLTEWLKIENIIRRITAATAIVADGKSPRDSLKFLSPGKPFAVKKKDGKILLDPQSYARYDLLAMAIESLPGEGAAKVFQDSKPLFEQAYEELGASHQGFQEALIRAINVLLGAPLVQGDIELRRKVLSYAMLDDSLENLSPAQKHLIRMGPKNAAKIQGKLREIARALGTPENQLQKDQTYPPKP